VILAAQPHDPPWYQRLWRLYRRLGPKQQAYKVIPSAVIIDLAAYCCAMAPAVTEREIGRRDVYLRIMRFREMDSEELTVVYANLTPEQRHQLWEPGLTYMEDE
jgi:hypothetical protein